ncbi:MAG: hypothetical protein ACE5EA_09355 [Nitrospirota bacterium]
MLLFASYTKLTMPKIDVTFCDQIEVKVVQIEPLRTRKNSELF